MGRDSIQAEWTITEVLGPTYGALFTNRQTLSGDVTLETSADPIQFIDPGGAARNVDLPAETDGLWYVIGNAADAVEDITVRDDGDATLQTLNQDDIGIFIGSDGGWMSFVVAGTVT